MDFTLPNGVPVRGFIDRVDIAPTGEVRVVDYKTGKAPPVPIVLVDKAYWTSVIGFDALVEHGMIARSDLDLIGFAEDVHNRW